MESPRRKLGTNLGPAPAFSVFAPPSPPSIGAKPAEQPSVAESAAPEVVPSPAVAPIENTKEIGPSAADGPRTAKVSKLSAKPARAPSAPLKSRQPVPEPSAGFKRMHGTFSEPYQRKTDSAQTRQTTLTVDLELDDRFETFFRRNRRLFRTRSSLWAAAMTYFLEAHEN